MSLNNRVGFPATHETPFVQRRIYIAQDGFERAWIYAREKTVDDTIYDWVYADLKKDGMNVSTISKTIHYPNRVYPSGK